MTDFELTHINVQRDRSRRVRYYYFRRNGRRWRLPGEPLSEEFMAEYRRLLAESTSSGQASATADRRTYPAGSFGALVNDYLASGAFKEKKPSTKAEYRRVLEALSVQHGHKPVRELERRHIRKICDERSDTPGAANTILRTLKMILNFAVDDGIIIASPAAKMKERRVGEWRSWTDDECTAYEQRWAEGTMQRRAYALARYTGQRKSDLVLMTHAHRKDGFIRVIQGKTGQELWIPEHSELTAELARGNREHMSLLTTSQGKAFDPVYFGAWFADAIEDAGLPVDCVLHGLRKTAARMLSEAGCSDEEIKAITGHTTSRMVSHYTKAANQKTRASAAILKLEKNLK
jgi:integrase